MNKRQRKKRAKNAPRNWVMLGEWMVIVDTKIADLSAPIALGIQSDFDQYLKRTGAPFLEEE